MATAPQNDRLIRFVDEDDEEVVIDRDDLQQLARALLENEETRLRLAQERKDAQNSFDKAQAVLRSVDHQLESCLEEREILIDGVYQHSQRALKSMESRAMAEDNAQ